MGQSQDLNPWVAASNVSAFSTSGGCLPGRRERARHTPGTLAQCSWVLGTRGGTPLRRMKEMLGTGGRQGTGQKPGFVTHCPLKQKKSGWGRLGGSVIKSLPSTQVVTLESQVRAPGQAPCREPASPSAYRSASLCLSRINKILKIKKSNLSIFILWFALIVSFKKIYLVTKTYKYLHPCLFFFFLNKDIYLFERVSKRALKQWQREWEQQTFPLSREPGVSKVQSQDPGIMTWVEGRCPTDWATQAPLFSPMFSSTCFIR